MDRKTHISAVRVRAEGRRISGTVVEYGDVATATLEGPERIERGALSWDAVPFTIAHNDSEVIDYAPGGGLRLRETDAALELVCETPRTAPGEKALRGIASGAFRGLSVGFQCVRERMENGVAVVEAGMIDHISLVRDPAYARSSVRLRRAKRRKGRMKGRGAWARARIETGKPLPCECVRGSSGDGPCVVQFEPSAFDSVGKADDGTMRRVPVTTGTMGPDDILGDTSTGAVEMETDADGSLLVYLMPPVRQTPAGAAVLASMLTAPPAVRPLIDQEKSEYEDYHVEGVGTVRVYTSAHVRAILVKFEGSGQWQTLELAEAEELGIDVRRFAWL